MKREFQTARRALALASFLLLLSATPAAARWNHSYPPDGDHPLRIVYYFVAPVGSILEWSVTRPLAVIGNRVAPYHHIDSKGFGGCSRERPARSCTDVIK